MGCTVTTSPQETEQLGERLGCRLSGGQVVAFTGPMGAGKTVFCTGLARGLGSIDATSSPTFSLVNFYRGRVPFAHFDAWRIEHTDDLEAAGFYDYLDSGAVVAVEWFENIAGFVSPAPVRVHIEVLDTNRRAITIEGVDGL